MKSLCKVFKPTSDNWHPSYKLQDRRFSNLVMIAVDKDHNDEYIVSFWGGDDFGMYRVFDTAELAVSYFQTLVVTQDTTIEYLKSEGFLIY